MVITDDQIAQAQSCINNYILGEEFSGRTCISEERMFLSLSQGDLDLIKPGCSFKGMLLYWVKRYVVNKYEDFWASLLDDHLEVTPNSRPLILCWADHFFNK